MARLKTIAEVINDAAQEIGITQFPAASVVSTADQDISQLRALAYAVAEELMLDEPYMALLNEGFWLAAQDGTLKDRVTADSDRVLIDGRLMVSGLKFRFLQAKGLEFGEPLRDYTSRLNRLAGQANGRVLDLDMDEGRTL